MTGPTLQLNWMYNNQLAYGQGDTFPCCGCAPGMCHHWEPCDCECHTVARLVTRVPFK